jgi:hypothetical protein
MVDTKTLTKYKCILASFMSFIHNRAAGSEYPRDHVHAIEVLAAVTQNDVVTYYLDMKTFGTTEPAGCEPNFGTCKLVGDGQKSNFVFHAKLQRVECNKN